MHPIRGGGTREGSQIITWAAHFEYASEISFPTNPACPLTHPKPWITLGVGKPGWTEDGIPTCRLASMTGGLGGCSERGQ